MTTENKTPGLRIVAGTEGPAEGTESNAAKIAGARARCRNYDGKPRKKRSDAGIPKKRGGLLAKRNREAKATQTARRGAYHKPIAPKPERDLDAERVEAYSDLESSICDCVNMGTIAAYLARVQASGT